MCNEHRVFALRIFAPRGVMDAVTRKLRLRVQSESAPLEEARARAVDIFVVFTSQERLIERAQRCRYVISGSCITVTCSIPCIYNIYKYKFDNNT